jgi:hypothetical protein
MDERARDRAWAYVAAAVLLTTTAQLVVGSLATGLPQFAGKGFAARLVAYPALMLLIPATWILSGRIRGEARPVPWAACALVMAPFLVDVTGNSADLYDTVSWWDDANHFVNWFLLCLGVGLLLLRIVRASSAVVGWLVLGLGALLAILWELGEWYTFIRNGTELATAYQDTLGDEALGAAGAALAGTIAWLAGRSRSAATACSSTSSANDLMT